MAWFALNKQAKLLLAGVFLAAAVVILVGYYRRSGPLKDTVEFVDVQNGQTFSIERTKIDQIPLKNPKTGELTLVPCYHENGATFVSHRYRGEVEELGNKNKCVDTETLAVRSTP